MHESSLPSAAARTPPQEGLAVRPTRGPPAAPGSPEIALLLADDHERIAERLTDVVVRRIFSAGLDLDATLAMIGEHRAAAKVRHAIGELDLAVKDIRDIVFDRRQTDPPAGCEQGIRP
jgi:hypothetical protein